MNERTVLVDSCVLIDLIAAQSDWAEWSRTALIDAMTDTEIGINPLIYAELAAGFDTPADLENFLAPLALRRLPLPWEAGYLAGHAFARYRKRGGERRSPLPDFYIGAHAAVAGLTLLTRDATRYRTYFPKLKLIAPDTP